MTPEERLTKIENLLDTVAEQQARTAEQSSRHEARLAGIEARFDETGRNIDALAAAGRETGKKIDALASASHDLIRVSRHLVRSHRVMQQLLEVQSRRMDFLEDGA